MESFVLTTAASGKLPADRRSKLLAFVALSLGWVAVQPSRPVSKDVLPSPVETAMSSTNMPSPWVAQSLTYVIDTSAVLPANAERSTSHCCQPAELPDAAFHAPVVPIGLHVVSALSVW